MSDEPASSVIQPCVFYQDPRAALDWLATAFGFETSLLVTDGAGQVGHAEMTYLGAVIGVGGEWEGPQLGGARMRSPASLDGVGTQFVRIRLPAEIDAHCARARAAGAVITQEPEDQFYGDRTYRARDLEGHVWNFTQTNIRLSIAEMAQASGLTITARV